MKRVDVEAMDGSKHLRDVTVLAEGYGICNRVPAYAGDCRLHICIRWDWDKGGRSWFAEHGALGTEDALRTRIARVVAEQKVETDDPNIRARADHMLEQWARQKAGREQAEKEQAERVARHWQEQEALYSLPLKMRRTDVSVKTDSGMERKAGYLSACGTWSIRKDRFGRYVISHETTGLRLFDVYSLKAARAVVAGLIAFGGDPMDKEQQPAFKAEAMRLKAVA